MHDALYYYLKNSTKNHMKLELFMDWNLLQGQHNPQPNLAALTTKTILMKPFNWNLNFIIIIII